MKIKLGLSGGGGRCSNTNGIAIQRTRVSRSTECPEQLATSIRHRIPCTDSRYCFPGKNRRHGVSTYRCTNEHVDSSLIEAKETKVQASPSPIPTTCFSPAAAAVGYPQRAGTIERIVSRCFMAVLAVPTVPTVSLIHGQIHLRHGCCCCCCCCILYRINLTFGITKLAV